jgi:hypothetical protein
MRSDISTRSRIVGAGHQAREQGRAATESHLRGRRGRAAGRLSGHTHRGTPAVLAPRRCRRARRREAARRKRARTPRERPRGRRWLRGSSFVARASQGWPATWGLCAATRLAYAATIAVICSEKAFESPCAQNGAQPLGSSISSANGSPPSGSVTVSSQSHSSAASGVMTGAASAKNLEGVPRCCGLTLGRAQVWLEAVPVPAVGVAVGGSHRDGLRAARPHVARGVRTRRIGLGVLLRSQGRPRRRGGPPGPLMSS